MAKSPFLSSIESFMLTRRYSRQIKLAAPLIPEQT